MPAPSNCLIGAPLQTGDNRQPTLEVVERNYILTVLQQTGWVITGPRGAAKILELNPSTLRNRMKKIGITRASHHIW
jgi:transcriptional regulator with GAF, ATPase, and Fis domain